MNRLLCFLCVHCCCIPAFAAPPAPAGDGITDDTAALQYLLDTHGEGTSLKLRSGAVYRITANLRRDSAIRIESTIPGKPAILRYDFDPKLTPPSNRVHLSLQPRTGPTLKWKEALAAGQTPKLAPPLDPAKRYIVAYGTEGSDQFDPAEDEHVGFADDGIYPPAPRAIRGDAHWVAELLTSTDGSLIQDIRLECSADNILDYALGIHRTRGALIRNISGDVPTFFQLYASESIAIVGVRGRVYFIPRHSSSNRVGAVDQSRAITITQVDVDSSDVSAQFMFENWCNGIVLDGIRIRRRAEADKTVWPPCQPVFFSNGGTKGLHVLHARIDGDLYLWDKGGQKDQESPRFDRIEHTGRIIETYGLPSSVKKVESN